MTTREKIGRLVEHLQTLDVRELAPEFAGLLEGVQILRGLGVKVPNIFEWLLPTDAAEADVLVDKLLALLFELRGDDLPPFDPGQYGESVIAELLGEAP